MDHVIYRPTQPGDEGALLDIWLRAYGDAPAYPKAYFSQLYRPGDGVAAEAGGKLRSAIYLVEGFAYRRPGQPDLSCTYLYALGTPPEERGKGYGGRTIWRSGVEGYFRGAGLVCFLPASPSLSRWYGDILGTRVAFRYRAFSVDRPSDAPVRVEPLSPQVYADSREALLKGTPHMVTPLPVIRLQDTFCQLGGGGLCQLRMGSVTALAAYDREENKLTLRELLCPQGDPVALVGGLLRQVGGEIADVHAPVFWNQGLGTAQDGAILVPGGFSLPQEPNAYWGLALD